MRSALALAFLLALASCGRGGAHGVSVTDTVVTLPAVPSNPGAAYFTIESDRPVSLVRVAGPAFARAELHDAGMRATARLPVTPDAPLAFAPGGRHAMLFGLDSGLRPGARIPLTFTFDGAPEVTVEAEVRAPGDVPMHMGH
jgi:periplasmic copper chaperone A